MNRLYRVVDDLYHIARRLKEVDVRYEVYFNRAKWRFEIYANGAMQIALPYDRLDSRTIDYVRSTRLERAKSLLEDIERENARLKVNQQKRAYESRLEQLEAML